MQTIENLKFRISLSSYNHTNLSESVKLIIEKINRLDSAYQVKSVVKGPIHLPIKKRYYSVTRSPHVDKDSHEQFQIKTHKWIMDVNVKNIDYINNLALLNIPSGVQISMVIMNIV